MTNPRKEATARAIKNLLGLYKRRQWTENRCWRCCQKSAMLGETVCNFHGGKDLDALRAAHERLLAMCEPAPDGLLRALESNDLHAIVAAARIVVNRAGLHPSVAVLVNHQSSPSWERWLTDGNCTRSASGSRTRSAG